MKFRYYITDLTGGMIKGTDDIQTAESYSNSEDYFIVDTETGEWLTTDGRSEIWEIDSVETD